MSSFFPSLNCSLHLKVLPPVRFILLNLPHGREALEGMLKFVFLIEMVVDKNTSTHWGRFLTTFTLKAVIICLT